MFVDSLQDGLVYSQAGNAQPNLLHYLMDRSKCSMIILSNVLKSYPSSYFSNDEFFSKSHLLLVVTFHLITSANSMEPDQTRQKVNPDLDPNFG